MEKDSAGPEDTADTDLVAMVLADTVDTVPADMDPEDTVLADTDLAVLAVADPKAVDPRASRVSLLQMYLKAKFPKQHQMQHLKRAPFRRAQRLFKAPSKHNTPSDTARFPQPYARS